MRKLFLLLLLCHATNALSDEYVFAGLGDVRSSIRAQGVSASSSNPVFGIAVGHKFSETLAVEAEYADFGSVDFSGGTASGYSAGIFALASRSVCGNCYGNDWALFGRMGVADTVINFSPAAGYALLVSSSQSKIAPAYGLGMQVTNGEPKPKILRVSYNRYAGGKGNTSATFSTLMATAGTAF